MGFPPGAVYTAQGVLDLIPLATSDARSPMQVTTPEMESAAFRRDLLRLENAGLYCPAGDFFVDPWRPVDTAIVTHGHSDHARSGSKRYFAEASSEAILRSRLGKEIYLETKGYGERWKLGKAWISLHPAGHLLGSAQVRIEVAGRVAVVSGDYKRQPDPTCVPFEVVPCDLFVTESTFGLPVFRWPSPQSVFDAIHRWWRENQSAGRTSLLMAYALGKSQRLLAGLDPSVGPIYVHGAVHGPTQLYRDQRISLPETLTVSNAPKDIEWSQCLVLAVPSAQGTPWLRRFGEVSTAMASGWMAIRGTRRRRAVDRGFVISDHVDWPGLLQTVNETGASTVWVTHGFSNVVARYLREQGFSPGNTLDASPLETQFQGDEEEPEDSLPSPEAETGP